MQAPAGGIEPTREVKGLNRTLGIMESTVDEIQAELDAALERQAIVERALKTLTADPALKELDHEYIEEYEERLRHFFIWHEQTKGRRGALQDAIYDLAKDHAERAGNGDADAEEASEERGHSEDIRGEVWSRLNDVVWPSDSEHELWDGGAGDNIPKALHALDAKRT